MSYSSHMKRLRATVILKDTPNWGQGIPGLTGDEVCIQLTRGCLSLIDQDDDATDHNWCVTETHSQIFAMRKSQRDHHGKQKTILLHREVSKPTDDQDVDHIDQHRFFRFKLVDNRSRNLRNVTASQNLANQRPQVGCSSIYKGVCWNKGRAKWHAQIMVDRRRQHLGLFTSEVEAAQAYNTAHKNNFPGIPEGLNKLSI